VGIVYDAGLLLALVTGCAIGALAAFAHYERAARRHWAYEREGFPAAGREADPGQHRRREGVPELRRGIHGPFERIKVFPFERTVVSRSGEPEFWIKEGSAMARFLYATVAGR